MTKLSSIGRLKEKLWELRAENERLRADLKTASDRCQMFLDTFGDVGDCVTQADINDWATHTSGERT